MAKSGRAFWGSFVHSNSRTQLEYVRRGLLVLAPNGIIDIFEKDVERDNVDKVLYERRVPATVHVVYLARGDFLIPGFIDTHTHAVQYPNIGLGQQYELLDWLQKVTFPREKKFCDPIYAEKTFESVVSRLISVGTTTCCYYSSIHIEASKILADICHRTGQRAFVGKCNMDRNATPDYREKSAWQSLEDTKEFIRYVRSECCSPLSDTGAAVSPPVSPSPDSERSEYGPISPPRNHARHRSALQRTATPVALSSLVMPIVTPRFAISCTDALLTGLSALVTKDPSLHIQTHLAENPTEIAFTKQLFPFASTYSAVYDHFNLLTPRTVLAHCVHLEDKEMRLIAQRGAGISHCPTSNFNLRSGASPVGKLLDHGIKVGLGTDVSGGFGCGILSALREASVSAKVVSMDERGAQFEGRNGSKGRSLTPMAPSSQTFLTKSKPDGKMSIVEAKGQCISHPKISTSTSKETTEIFPSPAVTPSTTSLNDSASEGEASTFADHHLSIATLFYLATLGGASVCNLEDRIGNFEIGKEFDAILVQTGQYRLGGVQPDIEEEEAMKLPSVGISKIKPSPYPEGLNPNMFVEPDDMLEDLFEKFLFTGDDRNIGTVFVRGHVIGGARPI